LKWRTEREVRKVPLAEAEVVVSQTVRDAAARASG
jgi:hypothetical protein